MSSRFYVKNNARASVENLSEENKVTLFKLLQAMTNDALKKDTKKAEKVE